MPAKIALTTKFICLDLHIQYSVVMHLRVRDKITFQTYLFELPIKAKKQLKNTKGSMKSS